MDSTHDSIWHWVGVESEEKKLRTGRGTIEAFGSDSYIDKLEIWLDLLWKFSRRRKRLLRVASASRTAVISENGYQVCALISAVVYKEPKTTKANFDEQWMWVSQAHLTRELGAVLTYNDIYERRRKTKTKKGRDFLLSWIIRIYAPILSVWKRL